MLPLRTFVLLSCLAVASAFTVRDPTWISKLANKQNTAAIHPRLRLIPQRGSGSKSLSMTFNPELLKTGIATYGIIIGAGGIIAGK
jgi:hypothetical protein